MTNVVVVVLGDVQQTIRKQAASNAYTHTGSLSVFFFIFFLVGFLYYLGTNKINIFMVTCFFRSFCI